MDLGGAYYNTKVPVNALESLIRKLPVDAPVKLSLEQQKPGRAGQLEDE